MALGGVPDNPTAGCTKWPAVRRSIGCATSASWRRRPARWPRTATTGAALPEHAAPFDDDELVMMFMTCHPALAPDARVALTLKVVGGFGVGEIARAFLMQEPAGPAPGAGEAALRAHDLPFALPAATDFGERLASVLDALYLMFSEGHGPTAGPQALKEDVAEEAMRLVTLLSHHPDGAARDHALRALMLLHAARLPGRIEGGGAAAARRPGPLAWDAVLLAGHERAQSRRRRCGRATTIWKRHRRGPRRRADVGRHRLDADPGAVRRAGRLLTSRWPH